MDFLKSEIAAKKRKAPEPSTSSSNASNGNGMISEGSSAPKKYQRKGDIEREERERKLAEEKHKKETWIQRKERKLMEAATKVGYRYLRRIQRAFPSDV